jgi:hypothetical protein
MQIQPEIQIWSYVCEYNIPTLTSEIKLAPWSIRRGGSANNKI